MLTVAKNYFRFFKESLKCNLASVLEYKKSFIIQSIFMFLNNGFFLVFWSVVFGAADGEINELTMNDILYLWSVPVLAYGIAFFFFGGIRQLGKYILEGGLDTFLTQPKNVIINVMMSGMEFSAFGDLLYGLVIGLVAVKFNMLKYLTLIIIGTLVAFFFICTETIIRILTIWLGNTDNFEHVYINTLLINFGSYPEVIYSNFVKTLIYTVIPSAYISFIPIKFINTFNIKFLLMFILAIIIYLGITVILCKEMLKKYESGNNITLRG